ncbi:MAG TPA: M64 family metallopeptidase [Steroidobacteraceae bacterium]|nr:M64 family metallopeptidase [Steroidobacteraceae bacterium]
MTRSLALLASVLLAHSAVAADAPAPATYRLDYFHTGGKGAEIFAVDRLRLEPLPWPGHPARAADDGQSGLYRYEVRDAEGVLLQARGFASVFGEWVTTEEAQRGHRTFHESVRFPAPTKPGPVHVRLYKRDAQQAFQPVWETTLDTTDMFVDRTAPAAQELIAVAEHGAPADKVDLLLIGDGYTAGECADKFRDDATRMTAALFAKEPFARRREHFNVWGLCPPAAESGISRPSTGVQRATPVGATYDAFGSERYVLTFENRALREVASRAPYEAIVILANGQTYGGGGIYNLYSTVAVDSSWSDYLFVHEFGHHFAALADEYYTSPVAYAPVANVVEPWEPNVTALLDADRLKWRALVSRSTPVPTPWPKQAFEAYQRDVQARRKQIRADRRPESEMDALFREEQAHATRMFARERYRTAVGAFRGANYDAQAYYRPQLDCIMFTRNEVPFCRVCEAALERVIDSWIGPGS